VLWHHTSGTHLIKEAAIAQSMSLPVCCYARVAGGVGLCYAPG